MNTFKRKSLYAALAGLSALGATGAAQAVNVNPDGLGQVLIYPYFTTRSTTASEGSPFNSLLSVVNSTNSGKAVKVRFLEGKNSREVLDFNLFLSPRDVWTAAVIPMTTGGAVGGGIFTTDKSCTVPTVSSSATAPTPFVNFAYSSDAAGDTPTLDRTREGYVEIIEMGNVTGATLTSITHVSGTPPCTNLTTAVVTPNVVAGNGGLFGGITLVNVVAGTDYTEDAVALANFSQTSLYADPGSILPNLAQVNPRTSITFNSTSSVGSEVVTTDWSATTNNVDAVSAVLMHDNIYNEYVLDAATKSGTDWVVTMPTKTFYYRGNAVTRLFQRNFTATGACDDVTISQYNREEATVQSQTTFSPPPPTQTDSLCWEANVITFNNSNVLGSLNKANITTAFQNGWLSMTFAPVATVTTSAPSVYTAHQLIGGTTLRTNTATGVTTTQAAATYVGLPVVGFALQSFTNGTLAGATAGTSVLSNYGGNFVHKTTRTIQ